MRCGLLGEKLGHSYSPEIHRLLADGAYTYELFEKKPDEIRAFLASDAFDGLNVTIPYKKTAAALCGELTRTASRLGCVNTVVRRADGTLLGDNTDYYGFDSLLEKSRIDVRGRKTLVFGSGGASQAVCAVLEDRGAGSVTVISRSGADNYGNLARHADAQILVNATPLGMFPAPGYSPADLRDFPACEGVLDLVYNPARTALLLQAEAMDIPCAGGLHMLVAQALRSSELFTGRTLDPARIDAIEAKLSRESQNIVLIGMPGCGKSSIAVDLCRRTGRRLFDSDAYIERLTGTPVPAIFDGQGEAAFRRLETQVLGILGKQTGAVIATGGGCVLREANYPLLRQNSVIVWIRRDTDALATGGRPISLSRDLHELYAERAPLYERFADFAVENAGSIEAAGAEICRHIYGEEDFVK